MTTQARTCTLVRISRCAYIVGLPPLSFASPFDLSQVTAEALDDLTTVVEDVMENTRTAFNESNATGYPLDPDAKKSKAKTSRFGDFWQVRARASV